MAAGLSLEEAKFDEFQRLFGELVTDWIDPALLQGKWCPMASFHRLR
jgi:single-stranded-DNA-specific exonuclease